MAHQNSEHSKQEETLLRDGEGVGTDVGTSGLARPVIALFLGGDTIIQNPKAGN